MLLNSIATKADLKTLIMSEYPPASKKHCLEVSGEMSNNHSTSGTSSGTIVLPNSNLQKFDGDFLYHLGYSKSECDERFSDVKVSTTIALSMISRCCGEVV